MVKEEVAELGVRSALKLLRAGNLVCAVSVEGDEASTDARRGAGVYAQVVEAMRLMKETRLPFGISCCYTRENFEQVSSAAFFDQMVEWGAAFAWYFHYMPVGSDADVGLMVTPEQRALMYHRVRAARLEKDLFAMDFQNDGQYVQGCIAGGRRYLHINAAGDMDPCVFVHFSDANIHDTALLDGLKGPLFMAYHDGQPFNDNMLRPCPLLENPEKLQEMVERTGARPVQPGLVLLPFPEYRGAHRRGRARRAASRQRHTKRRFRLFDEH